MPAFFKGRGEPIFAGLVISLALVGLVTLVPAINHRLTAAPTATPTPSAQATPAPVAILLPDELDRALQGVMTIANDRTFGTAFLIDKQGDFLTASGLVDGTAGLRLIDNTGGMKSVRLIGSDATLGIAMVRAAADGSALSIGSSATIQRGDPVVLLASPKVANLRPSNPGTVTALGPTWRIDADDLPGNLGGPVVGPGANVVAILIKAGTALPVDAARGTITRWQTQPGTPVALAPLPSDLQLQGSETTSAPAAGVFLQSVSPARVSAAVDALVTIQGSGFTAGPALKVHFLPLAGSSGSFDGKTPAVVNGSTITVKIPSGRTVQDYVIELINGDGAVVDSRLALTVTP